MIEFVIPGQPKGKGRPRMTKAGHTYTPADTAQYENLVKVLCMEAMKESGQEAYKPEAMLKLHMVIGYPIPKSASKSARQSMIDRDIRPTKKPDCDNVIKCIADALNGIAYHDDSQIVVVHAVKEYMTIPNTEVLIKEVGENAE